MRTTRFLLSRFLLAAGLAGSASICSHRLHGQPAAASVSGTVLSQDGQPVPNAQVSYYRAPRLVKDARGRWVNAPDQPYVSSKMLSTSSGQFAVSGLPEGTYSLCIDAPGFLRSCDWSGSITIRVVAGQPVTIPAVRLIKAAVFSFRVNDPDRRLPREDRINRPLVLGVLNEYGTFHAAERVSTDATGANFEVRIPYSRQMQIWIQSWKFRLAGADKSAIDSKGTRIPLRVEPGAVLKPFEITITGEIGS